MSQIIIINSAEALAKEIAHAVQHRIGVPMGKAVLSCLHPIEVPSDAGEVVDKVRLGGYALNANDPGDRGPNGDDYHFTLTTDEAAALITAHLRTVPRAIDGIAGKLEEAISGEDWNEAKSVLNNLWDLRDDGYHAE